MEQLKEYLSTYGATVKLAKATGMHKAYISNIVSGRVPMTLRSAILIEYGTEGKVRAESLLTDATDLAIVAYLRSAK